MNTPATLVPNAQTNDLVLRFIGGKNDGESVSISTKNCTLGGTRQTENNESVRDQCAIYRGPVGVTVKSQGDEVLINGEAKSVHWLEQGDRIQFSDSQAVEVVHLGQLESAREAYEGNTETVTETVEVAGERIDFVGDAVQDQLVDETNSFAEPTVFQTAENSLEEPMSFAESALEVPYESVAEDPVSAPVGDSGQVDEGVAQRFESLETSVNQLNDQAANVDRRFDRLEDSLNALTEHLERLATGSLSSASVNSTPAEFSSDASAAFVTEPVQDVTHASMPEAAVEPVVSAAPEIVETPAAPVDDSATPSAGDNYEKSIAALFSELGSTDTPEAPVDQVVTLPAAEPAPSEDYASQTNEPVDSALSSIPITNEPNATEQPEVGFTERMLASMHDEAPTLSSDEVASVVGLGVNKPDAAVESSPAIEATPAEQPEVGFTERMLASMHDEAPTLSSDEVASVVGLGVNNPDAAVESSPAIEATPAEQPEVGFTERMLASMHDEAPTLSSDEVASVVGLGIAKPETPAEVAPAAEPTPAVEVTPDVEEAATPVLREEARTESVADIFARLHSGASATEGADEAPSPAAPIRQAVQTTFEDIQASISAALEADVLPTSEATADLGGNDQVVAAEPVTAEPVAAEAVEAVEAVESAEPSEDVSSVMDKFRAGLVAEEEAESTEESADGRQKQDSVEDYMSMLMTRMNGDSESSDDSVTATVPELSDVNNTSEGGLLDKAAIKTLLTEEEFVPKQKPVPIKSLDKMRELANSTSRSAVQRSERAVQIERKKSLVLQLLALTSLGLAVLMIWLKSYIAGSAFTVIFILTSAYFLYDTVSPSQTKELVPVKKPAQKKREPEPTPDAVGE